MGFFDNFFSQKENDIETTSVNDDIFNEEDLEMDPDFYTDMDAWGGVKVAKEQRTY